MTSRQRSSLDDTRLNRRTGVRCGLRHVDSHFQSCSNHFSELRECSKLLETKFAYSASESSADDAAFVNHFLQFHSCHFQCLHALRVVTVQLLPKIFPTCWSIWKNLYGGTRAEGSLSRGITRMHARLTSDAARCPKHVGRILVRVSVIVQS